MYCCMRSRLAHTHACVNIASHRHQDHPHQRVMLLLLLVMMMVVVVPVLLVLLLEQHAA